MIPGTNYLSFECFLIFSRSINTQVEDRARDRIDAGLFLHIYEFSTPNTLKLMVFECMMGTDFYKARNMSGLDTVFGRQRTSLIHERDRGMCHQCTDPNPSQFLRRCFS